MGFAKATESFLPEIYPIRNADPCPNPDCVPKVIADMETSFDIIHSEKAGVRNVLAICQYMEGWGGYKRFPTELEVRAMSWASIACGAHGITWYTYAPGDEKNHGAMYSPETWKVMTTLAKEISSLHDVLAEPAIHLDEAVITNGPQANTLYRNPVVAIAKKHDGKTWIFAVNSALAPLTAQLTVPACTKAAEYKTGKAARFQNSVMTLDFTPYEVKILIAE